MMDGASAAKNISNPLSLTLAHRRDPKENFFNSIGGTLLAKSIISASFAPERHTESKPRIWILL